MLSKPLPLSLLFLSVLVAYPAPTAASEQDDLRGVWIAPTASDSRSPCPGLNAAANHGFLHRSGLNISLDDIGIQLSTIFPVDRDFLHRIPLQGAIKSGLAFELESGEFAVNLGDLHAGQVMEHDASLFRVDSFFGDASIEIDMDLVDELFSKGSDEYLTEADIMEFQTKVLKHSLKHNPEATFNDGAIFAMAEQAVFLLMMSQQDDLGAVRKDLLREWIVHERLPAAFEVSPSFPKLTFDGDLGDEVLQRFSENIHDILDVYNCNRGAVCDIEWLWLRVRDWITRDW